MDRGRVALAAALAWWLAARPARGQDAPLAPARLPERVWVEPPVCAAPPFDVGPFLRLLELELRADGVAWALGAGSPEDMALATVTLAIDPCDPATREVAIRVASASNRKGESHSVSIGDTPPPARARSLALAVAEQIRLLWPGLTAPSAAPAALPIATPPSPIATPPAPPPPAPGSAEALAIAPLARVPPASARAHAWAAVEVRALVPSTMFAGGRAGASTAIVPGIPILVTVDGGAVSGRAFDRLGTIDVVVASGALGLAYRGSLGRAIVETGPSIELGALWASGHPYDATTAAASRYAGVVVTAVEAAARGRVAERVWLEAALRGGVVVKGATLLADTREASAFAGGTLGLRTGVGVDF